jgi:hypothetical protein
MQTSLFIPEPLKTQIRQIAKQQNRSFSNMVCILIQVGLKHWAPQDTPTPISVHTCALSASNSITQE